MVKIKDFISLQKSGRGHVPTVPYTTPAHESRCIHLLILCSKSHSNYKFLANKTNTTRSEKCLLLLLLLLLLL